MPSTQEELRVAARGALSQGDQRAALGPLLELDDRFGADPWVLEMLARVHRRLHQPERGLGYAGRALELGETDDLSGLASALQSDYEAACRDRARFELVTGRHGRAFTAAMKASSVPNPSTWTIRILTDAAEAANRRDQALAHVIRVRELRPDDPKLADFEGRLRG